jgi:hypothetical protein
VTARIRAAYGTLLLAAPAPVLRLASGRPASWRLLAVARVLGARQLTQAAVTAVEPDALCLAVGAETDLAHAISMLAWGALAGQSRRIALVDATVAGLFAVAGAEGARRARAQAPTRMRADHRLAKFVVLRDRVAASVARRTLPAPCSQRFL